MKKIHYAALRPEEFLKRLEEAPVGYLPLGTLEWHGYHMPLGADSIQSQEVMERIAEDVGGIVFPPLFLGPDIQDGKGHYGMDICAFQEDAASQLAGSCYYVPEELFGDILKQTVANAKRAGFRLMVVHGHGPSINYVESHKAEFSLPLYTLFDLAYQGKDGIQTDHAASNETSITMALHPEWVDMDAIDRFGYPVASWGEDPRTGASIERGKRLIIANVEKAASSLKVLLQGIEKAQRPNLHYENIKNLLD